MPLADFLFGRPLASAEDQVLAVLAGMLLVIFGGITDRLIPLFAVGAFMAFTLSQAGMVAHWKRVRGRGVAHSMAINGLGAAATGATLAVVLAAKFAEGAWVVVVLAPAFIAAMTAIRRHYRRVEREVAPRPDFIVKGTLTPPVVVVPVETWNAVAQKALRLALTISGDIEIVHVEYEGAPALKSDWSREIEEQARAAGRPAPKLVRLRSPYRFVVHPIIQHVLGVEQQHPDRTVAVLISEMVERHWYHYFLHNQRGELLSALLLVRGDRRIVIVNVPWYLDA